MVPIAGKSLGRVLMDRFIAALPLPESRCSFIVVFKYLNKVFDERVGL